MSACSVCDKKIPQEFLEDYVGSKSGVKHSVCPFCIESITRDWAGYPEFEMTDLRSVIRKEAVRIHLKETGQEVPS